MYDQAKQSDSDLRCVQRDGICADSRPRGEDHPGDQATADTKGKLVYVEDGRIRVEDTLFNTMPQFVEAKHTEVLRRNCKCQEKLFRECKVDVDSSLSRAPFQGQSSKYMNHGRYVLLHTDFQRCMHRKYPRWY